MSAAATFPSTHRPLPALAGGLLASQAQRPKTAPLFLLPSVILTGIAHFNGGNPVLSDAGFLWMTLFCAFFLFSELRNFKTWQGWGAATFYLGVLVWFCHDYMTRWFHCNWAEWPAEYMPTVGKMAFLYCFFITLATLGMMLPVRDGAVRSVVRYPEPNSREILFWFAIITFALNIGYEACFSYADLLTTLKSRYFGGRLGQVGTSINGGMGAINISFSAYLTMLASSVQLGAIAGLAYAIFMNPPVWKRLLMFLIWGHVFMLAFGGGTRTATLGVLAPLVAFLLIKALRNPAFLKRALSTILAVAATAFVLMQIQTHHRMEQHGLDITQGLQSEKTFSTIEGNSMFSEALDDYIRIPTQKAFFYDNAFPGEGALRALPEMAFWFAISPVPRPLMTMLGLEKPIDPAWSWRARAGDQSGATDLITGTTCSYGLVGSWYFRFGPFGMMEGALLMGWAYAWVERILRSVTLGRLRLMGLVIGLFFLSTLFFFFRDVVFFAVWPPLLIFAGLAFVIKKMLPHH